MGYSSVMRRDALFAGRELSARLKAAENEMKEEVQGIEAAQFLNTNVGELVEHLTNKHGFDPPRLLTDRIYVDDPAEAGVDVSQEWDRAITDRSHPFYVQGTTFTYHIPFEGDGELLLLTPQTYTTVWPDGKVTTDNEIVWSFTAASPQANPNAAFTANLERIEQYLGFVRQQVDPWVAAFPGVVRTAVEARRQRLIFDRERAAQLGYPIRRRENAPQTYQVPLNRKKAVLPPEASVMPAGSELEPAMAMEIYEDVLRIMSGMVEVIARSPDTFRTLSEEALRDHFLVQLNNQYEGGATGETFNGAGKTDIFLRVKGKAIFIAECKFWHGAQAFLAAIDQLLSYLSWHDTKAAVVLFHRGRNLTSVLEKIRETVIRHPAYVSDLPFESAIGYRALLKHPADEARQVTLTVLAFQVPTAEKGADAKS
jgi:hypothetical protein